MTDTVPTHLRFRRRSVSERRPDTGPRFDPTLLYKYAILLFVAGLVLVPLLATKF